MITKDVLWKGIIEDLFEDFLHFFYPERCDTIDFSKGFEFLDKELQKIYPENVAIKRYADKLVKVFLKNGTAQWILIHIEVQGYPDESFAERMFTYHYRIYDRYKVPITALVIYTDEHVNFHPKTYTHSFWDTRIDYTFNTYELIKKTSSDFDAIENPFSIIMKTAWTALQRKGKVDILTLKINLAHQLMKQGFNRAKTERILNFIGHYIYLEKPEEKRIFEKDIDLLTKTRKQMGIMEAIKEELKRQAVEEGLAEGKVEGKAEGLAEGLAEGKAAGREEATMSAQTQTILKSLELGFEQSIIASLLDVSEQELLALVSKLINLDYLEKNQVKQLLA